MRLGLVTGAALLCTSATSAFSYGAISAGLVGDSSGTPLKTVTGFSTNRATKELAMAEANRNCALEISPIEKFVKPCWPVAVFYNQCTALARPTQPSINIRQQVAQTEREARDFAKALCEAETPGNTCYIVRSFCDGPMSAANGAPNQSTGAGPPIQPDESLVNHVIRTVSEEYSNVTRFRAHCHVSHLRPLRRLFLHPAKTPTIAPRYIQR